MNPNRVLEVVLKKLKQAGIDYMITGSFASNLYGAPRTTYDADVVIEARPASSLLGKAGPILKKSFQGEGWLMVRGLRARKT